MMEPGLLAKGPGPEQGHFEGFPGHRTGTLYGFSGTKYPNISLLGTDWLIISNPRGAALHRIRGFTGGGGS